MPVKKKVFSDSWDRVADRHACLLPGVDCQLQFYRGQAWRVLRAPYETEFYRLTEEAWGFVGRLSMDVTIDQAWRQAMEKDPEGAPGQEEAIEILGQLSNAGLILSDIAADSREMFKARAKEKRKMVSKQALNFLFLRVPVFNPDRFLTLIRPLGSVVMHPLVFVAWLFTVGWGLKSVFENWDAAVDQSSGFLAPENLPLVLVCAIVLKFFHELGHGIACKHFGGYVPTFGIMFILFAPLPYVDATASWGFREKWRRLFVSSAGMYAEFFIAAVAAVVWANAGEGLVKGLAYNVMLIGSISTVLFNMNPLLKFDGYYILSDLLSLPNLQQRSVKYLQYLLERFGFGRDEADNPAEQRGEAAWLCFYGLAAGVYRVFLMLSISLLVGQQFFEFGIALAVFTVLIYIIVPILKFFRYLATARELTHCRTRAFAVVGIAVGLLVFGVGFVPVPEHYQEPGLVRPVRQVNVSAGMSGVLSGAPVAGGQWVEAGTTLMVLENPLHEYDIAVARASLERLRLRSAVAAREAPASLPSIERLVEIETEKLARLERQREDLLVLAPISGIWVSPEVEDREGTWFQKGEVVGQIRDPGELEFLAIISQKEAAHLFAGTDPQVVGVRLWGEGSRTIPLSAVRVVPGEQRVLPSPALGWMGGGGVEVRQDDPDGIRTTEGFYLLRGQLAVAGENGAAVIPDRTGEIRIRVGSRPLALQVWHSVRQLLQRRLRI